MPTTPAPDHLPSCSNCPRIERSTHGSRYLMKYGLEEYGKAMERVHAIVRASRWKEHYRLPLVKRIVEVRRMFSVLGFRGGGAAATNQALQYAKSLFQAGIVVGKLVA